MIDVEKFIQSLKCTWVRNLIKEPDSHWTNIVNYKINLSHGLAVFGPLWGEKVRKK